MTRGSRGAAGINRELLEKSGAAGLKLIGNPAKLESTNFCRLCDLRSREVCLYRAPKDFAGLTAVENQVGTRRTVVPHRQPE
jgi:hypothetical protein